MRDVTPYLMGDPVASDRRPPTEKERALNAQFNRLDFKLRERRVITGNRPRSLVLNLPVGGWVIKPTKKGAVTTMKHMRTYGLQCRCIPTSEGKYQVIRTE